MRTAAFATLLVGALAIKIKEDEELWGGATIQELGEELFDTFGPNGYGIADHLYGDLEDIDVDEMADVMDGVISGDIDVDARWLTNTLSMAHAGDDRLLDEAELAGLAAKLGADDDGSSATAAMDLLDWD